MGPPKNQTFEEEPLQIAGKYFGIILIKDFVLVIVENQ